MWRTLYNDPCFLSASIYRMSLNCASIWPMSSIKASIHQMSFISASICWMSFISASICRMPCISASICWMSFISASICWMSFFSANICWISFISASICSIWWASFISASNCRRSFSLSSYYIRGHKRSLQAMVLHLRVCCKRANVYRIANCTLTSKSYIHIWLSWSRWYRHRTIMLMMFRVINYWHWHPVAFGDSTCTASAYLPVPMLVSCG